jgi:RNA polymerase sigma factor (sigma-70 family)
LSGTPADDRTTQGGRRGFPTTSHSIIAALADPVPEERRRAFGTLVETYWRPVYVYIRLRWRAERDDARDLTQEFFTRALERDFFAGYDQSRARFRTFLRVCLDRFLSNERAAATRRKRGGDVELVSLDFETAERELVAADAGDDADAFFRREWVRALIGRAVGRLRSHPHFALFQQYDLHQGPGDRPTYQALAAERGIPVTQITNHLAAVRREFRRIVLDELHLQAGSDAEFRADARELLGVDPV